MRGPAARSLPLFYFGLAILALPVLAFRFVTTQDGGAHFNTAMALAQLHSGSASFVGHILEVRPTPPSNQLASRVMALLAEIGFVADAERLTWLFIFIGFVAVVVGNFANRGAFALLLFPLATGVLVNLGFINYVIGLIFFIESVFVLQAGLRKSSIGWMGSLVALSVATYLSHPFAGFALAATVGPAAIAYLARWRLARFAPSGRSFSPLVPVGCALSCAILLSLAAFEAFPQIHRFLHATASSMVASNSISPSFVPDTIRERLLQMGGLDLVSYSPIDYMFSISFGLILIWLACRCCFIWVRTRQWRSDDDLVASIVVLLALSVVVPRDFEFFMPERLVACLVAVAVIWLSSTALDRSASRALLVAGLMLNGGYCLWRLHWSAQTASVLTEYASVAAAIPDNATLLSIRTSPSYLQLNCWAVRPRQLPCNFKPTLHFMGDVVGGRPIVLLSNYQLRSDAGFFPIALRAPWSEYASFEQEFEHWPPPTKTRLAEITALVERAPPDVIVTWDERLATGASQRLLPAAAELLLQHYKPVFTSHPLGAATVYIRRAAP